MPVITLLPADGGAPCEAVTAQDLEAALLIVAARLSLSSHASKDRVNLEALEEHCGQVFAQPYLIPDSLFESVRRLLGVVPFVLLPPDVVSVDAVLLLADWHGAMKGLPPNQRANALVCVTPPIGLTLGVGCSLWNLV